MKYLKIYLKKYMRESILAPLFKMLEALFDLFVPIVVARLINTGIGERDSGVVWQSFMILIALALIGLLCSFVAQYFAAKAATGTAAGMRHDLMKHIYGLDSSSIDQIGTSTLITRMTSDMNQVQNGLNLFLRLFLRSPFIVFGAMVMAFTIDSNIALIFVCTIPILSVIIFGVMKWTSPRYRQIQEKLDLVTRATRQNLSGVRVIRAFGREEDEVKAFQESNHQLNTMQNLVGRISSLMNPLTYVVVNLGIVAVLYAGARKVDGGVLLNGNVIALVNYLSQILVELIKLANLIVTLSRSAASLRRIEDVLDQKPSMAFPEGQKALPSTDEAVRFDRVSLTYAGAGDASLHDISFTALKGQTIGVIGGTGSGKTSLVSLINRMYDATEGTVSVYGLPVREWDREQLRCMVGVVPQKAQLFSGTIRENLLWGNPGASEEELWEALTAAQAADFVRIKPDGLEERIEQGGRNLSGGQRQRLAIARALVRKPSILILDDSASALDFATDAALRKALRELPWETTCLIVSQRTSSIRHADQILVLEDGRLAARGTHEELLSSCPVYQEIYDSQFRKEGDQ